VFMKYSSSATISQNIAKSNNKPLSLPTN